MLLATALLSGVVFCIPAPSAQTRVDDHSRQRDVWHPVRTIDPNDEDFSDLDAVRHAIGDASVVALGEATHSDAAAYRAKVRVVKFLHEQLGFDVLVWEAGLLDGEALNRAIANDAVPLGEAARRLMCDTWATSAAVRPLFAYARASHRSDHPLEFAGMDGGHLDSGPQTAKEFFDELYRRVPSVAGNGVEQQAILDLVNRTYRAHVGEATPATKDVKFRDRTALQQLQRRMRVHAPQVSRAFGTHEAMFYSRAVASLLKEEVIGEADARYATTRDRNWFLRSNAAREHLMAENLLWLRNNRFHGKKIIIWAATAHIQRHAHAATNQPRTTGDYLAAALGRGYYVIAFTAGRGEIGIVSDCGPGSRSALDAPPQNSFELRAAATSLDALFVDLRALPATHSLAGSFSSNAIGYSPLTRRWRDSVDAFFYVDRAEPDTVICDARTGGPGSAGGSPEN